METRIDKIKSLAAQIQITWPKQYLRSSVPEIIKMLNENFGKYRIEHVEQVYKDLMQSEEFPPSISKVIKMLDEKRASMGHIAPQYFEDSDGYGYLKHWDAEKNEAVIDCIWKPRWAQDRTVQVPGDDFITFLPAKSKAKVLAEHGVYAREEN